MHWNSEHKRICRTHNKMNALVGSQQLPQHERMDISLLSHFLARVSSRGSADATVFGEDDPVSTFLSLLPGSANSLQIEEMIPKTLNHQKDLTRKIYSRFHNNNFAVHSHMTIIGHGVFPLASRLFNHSCIPNAAPRYILEQAKLPLMEIVALRDIDKGEEVGWKKYSYHQVLIFIGLYCRFVYRIWILPSRNQDNKYFNILMGSFASAVPALFYDSWVKHRNHLNPQMD